MALINGKPMKWTPRGTSDTLDASNTFTGAMRTLQDLIRDPTTMGVFVCRPASDLITAFTGPNAPPNPGFVSWFDVVGNQIYGLVASSLTPGFEQPFCYDIGLNSFIAVGGITGANVPSSPAASGAWTPPTSALVSTVLVVTHPGFPGGVGKYFGWFDVSNPAAPNWNAGNTATNALPFAPVAVYQFSNRAYFASGKFLVYSDVLSPLTVTNATQALTLGDSRPITALGGLPTNNLTASISQALIAFKSQSSPMNMYQVTGDAALGTLSVNGFNVATGTLAPMTICATPKGLAFMAPDGLRFIDFASHVSDPVNTDGSGVSTPFIDAVVPSRMCAACNGNIMRVATQNGDAPGTPQQEYWFDFKYSQWTGPHTFPPSSIKTYLNKFIIAATGVNAKLFTSAVQQESTSVYTENGVAMSWVYSTPMLPDTGAMAQNSMVETTIDIAFPSGALPYLASASDQNGSLFDSVGIVSSGNATLWGAFQWGQAQWLGALNALSHRQIPWHEPIVFERLSLTISGSSAGGMRIGSLNMRYQQLGYLQANLPIVTP